MLSAQQQRSILAARCPRSNRRKLAPRTAGHPPDGHARGQRVINPHPGPAGRRRAGPAKAKMLIAFNDSPATYAVSHSHSHSHSPDLAIQFLPPMRRHPHLRRHCRRPQPRAPRPARPSHPPQQAKNPRPRPPPRLNPSQNSTNQGHNPAPARLFISNVALHLAHPTARCRATLLSNLATHQHQAGPRCCLRPSVDARFPAQLSLLPRRFRCSGRRRPCAPGRLCHRITSGL